MSFGEARRCVLDEVGAGAGDRAVEEIGIEDAQGRVLAGDIPADRDYPAAGRSIRDGFAVRAADLPGELRVIGEVRAGTRYEGAVGAGEAVEIMTGAPMPRGANAVVMVETVTRADERVRIDRPAAPGQFVNPQGAEAHAGDTVVPAGTRLDYAAIAMLASVGCYRVPVFDRPKVAIVATGDEIVDITCAPAAFQVRNSNAYALAAQVHRAGGTPEVLGVARDEFDDTRGLVDRGLASDLLLLSGGVSAGKYDIVERVLEDFGARFFFDRVLIQPGQPLVFGRAGKTFFFRAARQSRVHHGDLRALRTRGGPTAGW